MPWVWHSLVRLLNSRSNCTCHWGACDRWVCVCVTVVFDLHITRIIYLVGFICAARPIADLGALTGRSAFLFRVPIAVVVVVGVRSPPLGRPVRRRRRCLWKEKHKMTSPRDLAAYLIRRDLPSRQPPPFSLHLFST